MASNEAGPKLCRRCKVSEATHEIRIEPACRPCYCRFVNMKTVKRLEVLAKQIGAAPTQTKKILVGLSFGASSASLVNVLDETIQHQLSKRPTPAYNPVMVHIDTDLSSTADDSSSTSQKLLDRYSERYPRFQFTRIPLTDVLDLETIDWSALPVAPGRDESKTPGERLQDFFARLPSTTSRADVLRLFVRHLLISTATREGSHALLLGYSTTALAELTLGETAKGRGYSLPWMVDDGPQSIRSFGIPQGNGAASEGAGEPVGSDLEVSKEVARLPIYYPLRDVFRKELTIYTGLVSPPLTDLLGSPDLARSGSAVVSHKDVSIDDVMSRYFQDVEENYPSIVANVVRTTAKLERLDDEDGEASCGLCGMGLDELGDERWKGEIGDDGGEYGRLCYGCQRAMRI
ncbi:hypothetical protein VMCG_00387 [Cytospora schulzeri]|uniref:Cytoplasmic tRNA 2-thiolation protein 2 n=1 Tax=Cytospora schulzeri TaxID=448051 RepID=A0A423X8W3_9PEZI|nr:hypothetical protein VMCG_00387 [Valsa malicola]